MVKKLLVGDIGGTNTTLGVFNPESNKLFNIKNFITKENNIEKEIKNFLEKYSIDGVSLALAGPVIKGDVKLTNVDKEFSSKKLTKKIGIDVLLINDFEALGYYAKNLGVKRGAVVGAGTGLGKVLIDTVVISSEGGRLDFPFEEGEEKHRRFFTKKLKRPPEYDDLVSGRGISMLKEFHSNKKLSEEDIKPENVFTNKNNFLNKKVIDDFSKFYARFIRNTYKEFLPEKILIAGGIARKNPWIIHKKEFESELERELIKKTKIKIIKDEYAGLRGAGFAFIHKNI